MSSLVILGWREWCALPELGLVAIKAKVDTGARSSALHVDSMETFTRDDQPWVRFSFRPGRDSTSPMLTSEARIVDRRMVTDSGGHSSLRVFIRTSLQLAGQTLPIEINLTRRSAMLFPMLLGRTALSTRFLVDSSRSYLCGEPVNENCHPVT